MSIEVREATSPQMKKNIRLVKRMSSRIGFDENIRDVNWKVNRRIYNLAFSCIARAKGVKFESLDLAGKRCLLALPEKDENKDIILYIHGGGFVYGSAGAFRAYSSMLAREGCCKVVAADYSLAPEHGYPNALEDCLNIYRELLANYPDGRVSLVGDSAEATLSLVVALKIMDEGMERPKCVTVHSPFVDFSGKLDREFHKIDDFIVKKGCMNPLREMYVGTHDVTSPYISPIYGEFANFPPLFITCDSDERLYADAVALYRKAEENGVKVKMIEMKNTYHAFAAISMGVPETMEIIRENIEFMKNAG